MEGRGGGGGEVGWGWGDGVVVGGGHGGGGGVGGNTGDLCQGAGIHVRTSCGSMIYIC